MTAVYPNGIAQPRLERVAKLRGYQPIEKAQRSVIGSSGDGVLLNASRGSVGVIHPAYIGRVQAAIKRGQNINPQLAR